MLRKTSTTIGLLLVCLFANAQQGDFDLFLKAGKRPGVELTVKEDISLEDLSRARVGDAYYLLLQFSAIPGTALRSELAAAGVTLFHYVPNFAYIARVGVNTRLENLPVRAMYVLQPEAKLDEQLAGGDYPASAMEEDGVALNAVLFPGIDPQAALSVLQVKGFQAKLIGDRLKVIVPAGQILNLAADARVMYLEPWPAEPAFEGLRALSLQRMTGLSTHPQEGWNGAGMQVAIGDDGRIEDHIDFQGRIVDHTQVNLGGHGEMVGGIFVGAGNIDPLARGMAPAARLHVFDIEGYPHLFNAPQHYQQYGITITSTSFSDGCGGYYSQNAQFLDGQVRDNPSLLHVFSAGNSSIYSCSPVYGGIKAPDGTYFGNITGGMKVGKNVIAVGNVEYNDHLQIRSSRGPTQDGRVKPDIVANGQGNLTTDENNQYRFGGGTSAASPALAGSAAILYQAYRQANGGADPNSGLIKALLLNTADDLGRKGPDYEFGWGRVHVGRALESLQKGYYLQGDLAQGQQHTHQIQVPAGTKKLRVMLYWHDVPGSVISSKALVNDLDLKVRNAQGQDYLPLVLNTNPDLQSLTAPAMPGIDRVNNVEQVVVENPAAGVYTLSVDAFRLPELNQAYTLVYYFDRQEMAVTFPANGEGLTPGEEAVIRWDALGDEGTFTLEYSTDNQQTWKPIATGIPGHLRYRDWVVPITAYGRAYIRLTRNGSSVVSDQAFHIIGQPAVAAKYQSEGSAQLTWDPVPGANLYDVYVLGNEYMEVYTTVSSPEATIFGLSPYQEYWFSVLARNTANGVTGRRSKAIKYFHKTCDAPVKLTIKFDKYPAETSWEIVNEAGYVMASGNGYGDAYRYQELRIEECLPEGCFTFRMFDSYGDGICCVAGNGFFSLTDAAGNELAAGGQFGKIVEQDFCIGSEPSFEVEVVQTQPVSCAGTADAVLQVIAQGGSGSYTYLWNNGQTTAQLAGVGRGAYRVTVTDGNDQRELSIAVQEPEALTLDLMQTDITCSGATDGRLVGLAQGGTTPYSYQWSQGGNGNTAAALPAGTYRLTVTDANNCQTIQARTLQEPTPVIVALNTESVSCFGSTDGKAEAFVTGGKAPYAFQWSTGSTDRVAAQLAGGGYFLTVTDAKGCVSIRNLRIDEPQPLKVEVEVAEPGCGAATAEVKVNATGGSGQYQFQWANGLTGNRLNLPSGNHQVVVTDSKGCEEAENVELTIEPELSIELTTESVTCAGGTDGAVALAIVGGQGPFDIRWSNGARETEINGMAAGQYAVTVTDAKDCRSEAVVNLSEPSPVEVSLQTESVSCFGGADGAIKAVASGGNGAFSYTWSTGATGAQLNGLQADRYRLTVTDSRGCSQTAVQELSEPGPVNLAVQTEGVQCHGEATGKAAVLASGGTGPFTYRWSNGVTTRQVTQLPSGFFTVTVTDANQCANEALVEIEEPEALEITLQTSAAACDAQAGGSIVPVVTGGRAPYHFSWNSGHTTQSLNNLAAGSYQLTVTDAAGCRTSAEARLEPPTDLELVFSSAAPSCYGAADGSVAAEVKGGEGPYTFRWEDGRKTAALDGLTAGAYRLTVTDANGCQLGGAVHIQEPTPMQLATAVVPPACADAATGQIEVSAAGGAGGYSYQWSHGSSGNLQAGLAEGAYEVVVTDANGCTLDTTLTLEDPDPIDLSVAWEAPSCPGKTDGNIQLAAAGGTGSYQFQWAHGAAGSRLDEVGSGSFRVTVTDQAACAVEKVIEVPEPQGMTLHLNAKDVTCSDAVDGAASVAVVGGQAPYTYQWVTGDTLHKLNNLQQGTYRLTVTDANACQVTGTASVQAPPSISVQASVFSGDQPGRYQVDLQVQGGVPPYQYRWSHGLQSEDLPGLEPGSYSVTVTDQNGCQAGTSFLIESDPVDYCASFGKSTRFEWLESFALDTFLNVSGNDNGYGNYTGAIIDVLSGADYSVELEGGYKGAAFAESWFIWIDFNRDGDFSDAGERVYYDRRPAGSAGVISIPSLAEDLVTRMRVSMRFVDNDDQCGAFPYGETEDYTLRIKGDPALAYCPSQGRIAVQEWIERVKLGKLEHVSGKDSGYGNHRDFQFIGQAGVALPLELEAGLLKPNREFWRIWIDFDQDRRFEETELVLSQGSSEAILRGSLELPSWLPPADYVMRVSMKWELPAEPCETFYWGEVEDYTLTVLPADASAGRYVPPAGPVPIGPETPGWEFHPNPADQWLELTLQVSEAQEVRVVLLNALGEEVGRFDWTVVKGDNRERLPLSHLPAGLYYLRIANEARQLIIQH